MRSICIIIFLILSLDLISQEKTFVREYTYNAGEMDSKLSSRAIAVNQLRMLLLQEVGVYIESEQLLKTYEANGKFTQDFIEKISTLTAGITKLEVIDETWNGEIFWMKASITIDEKGLTESLDQLIKDRSKVKELEETKAQLEKVKEELNVLRKDSKSENPEQNDLTKNRYNVAINSLTSIDFFLNGKEKDSRNDFNGAILDYTEAIKLNPNYGEAYNNRGIAKTSIDDFGSAMDDFNRVIQLMVGESDGYANRAILKAHWIADHQGAIIDFNKAIEIDHDNPVLYRYRGESNLELQNYKNAIVDFNKAILIDPKEPLNYFARSKAKLGIEDYKGAVADLNKVIELDPRNVDAYYLRGDIKNGEFGDYKGAIDDYSQPIFFDPNNLDTYYMRAEFRIRAKIKYEDKDYNGALADYNMAIAIKPKDPNAYCQRANLKAEFGHYEEAIQDFTKAIFVNPNFGFAYHRRGIMKFILKDYRSAILDSSKAIELEPQNGGAYLNRGLAKINIELNDSGCLDLSKAGDLGDTRAYFWIKKGCN
jgi:tetratricopeptide (TPR) repeat protein